MPSEEPRGRALRGLELASCWLDGVLSHRPGGGAKLFYVILSMPRLFLAGDENIYLFLFLFHLSIISFIVYKVQFSLNILNGFSFNWIIVSSSYEMMLSCWHCNSCERPTFSEILRKVDAFIQQTDANAEVIRINNVEETGW